MQEMPSNPGDSSRTLPAIILADEEGSDSGRETAAAQSDRRLIRRRLIRRHWEMLATACGIILLSSVLIVRSDEHAAFALLPNCPIPSSCPSRAIFGINCAGCGLTRSFIFLAHGDWQNAFARNRMGWLLALAVVLQIPYRLVALFGRNLQPLGQRFPRIFGTALIVALFGNWFLLLLGI